MINKLEMPLAAFRFRVVVSHDTNSLITQQTKSCVIDFAAGTVDLVVAQPEEDNGMTELIRSLKSPTKLTVEYMKSGSGNEAGHSYTMSVKMVSHTLELSYSLHDIAKHLIKLKIA